MEKKFGTIVVITAHRTALPLKKRRTVEENKMTKKYIQEKFTEEMVFPGEIIGRRIRHKVDGSEVFKIYLDRKDQTDLEERIDVLSLAFTQIFDRKTTLLFGDCV